MSEELNNSSTLWLVLRFGSELKGFIIKGNQSATKDWLPKPYKELTSSPGSTGHYDWLRSSPESVIGIRYWPFDDACHENAVNALLSEVSGFGYARLSDDQHSIQFLFGNSPWSEVDEDCSNDQDLADNGIIHSDALGFGMYFEVDLGASEIDSLQSILASKSAP